MSEDAGRTDGTDRGTSSTTFEELPDAPPKRPLRLTLVGKVAVSIVAFWLVIAVVGPWIAPYHEADIVADDSFTEAGTFCSEWEPDQCSFHLIGTDYIGRDLLSRIIYGARTTIGISIASTGARLSHRRDARHRRRGGRGQARHRAPPGSTTRSSPCPTSCWGSWSSPPSEARYRSSSSPPGASTRQWCSASRARSRST